MSNRSPDVLTAVLVAALLLGCGGGEAETPAVSAAPPPTAQAEQAEAEFELEVTADEGEFRSVGTIRENQLFTVADEAGNGLGFRPSFAGPAGADGERLIAVEVIRVENAGNGQTEHPLAQLQLREGSSGRVDPGDGEGTFTVRVKSVQR